MHPHAHEPISPELVLVDPELAARVRPVAIAGPTLEPTQALSPDAPTIETPAQPPVEPPATRRDAPAPVPAPSAPAHRPQRSRAGRLASTLATLAALGLLAAAFLPPRDAPRLTDSATPATAAPRAPITLAWQPVGDADYYLVEMFLGEKLVHAQSARTPRLVAPSWLRPGRYTWRVFAGTGRPVQRKTRGPLENGWFVVTG